MLNAIIGSILFGLPAFALPVAVVSYVMIVVGRWIAGIRGMRVAVVCSTLFVLLAFALFVATLIGFLRIEGTPYPDQIKSVLLSGSLALNAGLGFGAVVFFRWWDQWERAQAIRSRR